jgi:ABC-type bacteriocin/lantibiotic exporter with double-glycine peptidase domain
VSGPGWLRAVGARVRLFGGGRRIPHLQSLTATDCGAACVAMVCNYHGKRISVPQAREALGTSRDGTTIAGLLEGARRLGLRVRPLRVELDGIKVLKPGTILFWNFNHFVVFEGMRGGAVRLVDPGVGRRAVPLAQFARSFTGLCVELEPGEAFTADGVRRRTGRRLVDQLRGSRAALAWVVLFSLILQVLLLAVPAATGLVIDNLVPRQDRDMLGWLVAGGIAVAMMIALAEYVRQLLLVLVRAVLEVDLSLGFLDHMMRLPFAFFQVRQAGDLMARMNSMVYIRQIVSSSAISALLDGILVLLYLVLVLLASPALAALVLAFAVVRAAVFFFTYRRQKLLTSEELERQGVLRGYQVEMLGGMESVKSSAIEDWVAQRWTNLYVESMNVTVARDRLDAVSAAARKGLEVGAPLAILLAGAGMVMSGELSLGAMFTVVMLAGGLLAPVDRLFLTGVELVKLRSYMERVDDVLEVPPEQDPAAARPVGVLSGGIELDEVSFQFSGSGPPVVNKVSMKIAPHQKIAIVGRTGCGKSTLAKLLYGLYHPTAGRVLYDGQDLAELDHRALREQMGVVPQNPSLLDGSIRDNIAPAGDLSLEDVVRAAKAAAVHDDIMNMPMRYETRVVSGATSFSGGQKQRIAIARAVARRPTILVLDEATSSLDTVTEAIVHGRLSDMPITLVLIAHRVSTVRNADRIYVMDQGRIAEEGTHDQLVARRGLYYDLVRHQLAREDRGEPLPMREAG